ncbi:MAG: dual specificity protein phosphatase family protein [Promicromonosporaceae bacterium]|nr:dual specificity protein phosphatase family protein [Promicromonosporaceae bacterium]
MPSSPFAHPADITWLTDDVATGGDFDYNPRVARAQLDDLIQQGVTLVIDTRIEDDDAAIWAQVPGVEYIHLPQDDYQGYHIASEHFDKAVELARAAIAAGGKVFVHCHMGINRGPSTAYAILLDQGMGAAEAFDLIRARRPIAAVYYAEDALRADLARRNTGWNAAAEALNEFAAHHDKVFGRAELAQIQHIIRDTHIKRGDFF